MPATAEILEEIDEVLAQLREVTSEGIPVLVEGEKDITALRRLGIGGKIQKISGRGTLLNQLEKLSGFQEIIVLTDFDRAGKKLADFCEKHLPSIGVKPNTEFRKKLMKLVRKDVKDIEGLAEYVLNQRAAVRG